MAGSRGYRIIDNRTMFPSAGDDPAAQFLSVRAIKFQYELPQPAPSAEEGQPAAPKLTPELSHLIVDRGDSSAVMIHDKATDEIILVRQFRPATLRENSLADGWLVELPAGRIEDMRNPPDTPLSCAIREAREETGYEIKEPRHIATILPSPGACSERIYIYYADDVQQVAKPGGVAAENENIQLLRMKREDLFKRVEAGEIIDAKLLLAAQWLRTALNSTDQPVLKPSTIDWTWGDGRTIGIQTGPIDEVKGIDAWINPENTDMQMARFFEPTISGRIRYLGAKKSTDGTIESDLVAIALRQAVADQIFVRPGSVLATTSGELARTHEVREILHVATTQYYPSGEVFKGTAFAAEAVKNALVMIDARNRRWFTRLLRAKISSLLVPLIGAGPGGVTPSEAATAIVPAALKFLNENSDTALRRIHFLAWKGNHRDAIVGALETAIGDAGLVGKVSRLQRVPPAGE